MGTYNDFSGIKKYLLKTKCLRHAMCTGVILFIHTHAYNERVPTRYSGKRSI